MSHLKPSDTRQRQNRFAVLLETSVSRDNLEHPPHGPGVGLDELVVSDNMRGHCVVDPPAVGRDQAVGHQIGQVLEGPGQGRGYCPCSLLF